MWSVEIVCICGNPANPDNTLIGCANEGCGKWLHDECLKHDALSKTFKRLGKDKPHTKTSDRKRNDKDEEQANRPLSPTESGAAESAMHSIDVKANGDGEAEQDVVQVNDNVDVRRSEDDDAQAASEERLPSSESHTKD